MTSFDAYFLPELNASDEPFRIVEFGSLSARVPVLEPAQLANTIAGLQQARADVLRHTPAADIVRAIANAAARVTSRETVDGQTARQLLPLATGYSAETIEDLLTHMAHDWSAPSLHELLQRELGNPSALDADETRRTVRARGPQFCFHIFSGNVPGVAVTAIIRSLLVKAATLGKTASGEPVLPVLFARALADVAPDLARALAILYWPGGTQELEAVALTAADTVIVYGGEETVQSVRARVRSDARLLVHGPRISFGIVGRERQASVARDVARAVAAYDQQGCVSPHVVYVERNGTPAPKDFARLIAHELAALATTQPRRQLAHNEAVAIQQLRAAVEFRGIAGADAEVFSSNDTSYTVLYDDALALPVSCLNRTLYVISIESAEDLWPVLTPHKNVLQSVAVAGIPAPRSARIIAALIECGASRITTFERLPWPPMWWHHDGRGPLNEMLTWVDIES